MNVRCGSGRCEGGSVISSLLKAVADVLTLDALDAAPKSASDDSSSQNGDDDMVTEGEEEGKAHTVNIGQVCVSFVHLEDMAHHYGSCLKYLINKKGVQHIPPSDTTHKTLNK